MNASNIITDLLPHWAVMWLLAGCLFVLGKIAVLLRARRRGEPWPLWTTVAWFALWPGMDPEFVVRPSGRNLPTPASRRDYKHVAAALTKMMLGSLLLWGAARQFSHTLAAGWCGMTGLILMLHFGVFELIAIFWRSRGFRATPIMNAPITSFSVAEFWGQRWNSAFRDLAHPFFFRPVARRWGNMSALWFSFTISGLVHELVISVPAGAGYGLPTSYFLLQALGITLERKLSIASGGRAVRWCFTHAFTALPAFILFHPPFVERVMLPFFHVIGAFS